MINVEQVGGQCNPPVRDSSLQIVHSTPGRLRVCLAWLRCYPSLHKPLSTSILSLAAVREVHLTPAINSIVVCYDPQGITEKAFQEKFCQLLQQRTPVHWLTAVRPRTDDTTSPGEGIISEAAVTGKIQEVGGKLIGSSVGWVMGSQRRCYRRTSRRGMVVLAAGRPGKNHPSGRGAVNLNEFWAISQ